MISRITGKLLSLPPSLLSFSLLIASFLSSRCARREKRSSESQYIPPENVFQESEPPSASTPPAPPQPQNRAATARSQPRLRYVVQHTFRLRTVVSAFQVRFGSTNADTHEESDAAVGRHTEDACATRALLLRGTINSLFLSLSTSLS